MEEVWKDIEGYKGLYQVSNLGRVKNLNKILTPFPSGSGNNYLKIYLYKNKQRKGYRIHRLVYETFYGKIPFWMEINHINEDTTDNRLENLMLCNHKENMNWGTINQRLSTPILQYDLEGNFIKEWKSVSIAAETLNFTGGGISNCLRNKTSTYKGYVWKYKFGNYN